MCKYTQPLLVTELLAGRKTIRAVVASASSFFHMQTMEQASDVSMRTLITGHKLRKTLGTTTSIQILIFSG